MLSGDNSILKRAGHASEIAREESAKEEVEIAWNGVQIDGITNRWNNEEKSAALQTELKKADDSATATLNGSNIEVQYKGYEIIIDVNGGSIDISKLEETSIVKKSFSIGDTIEIAGEYFYVIENSDENSSTVKMIAVLNVDPSSNAQKLTAGTVYFDESDTKTDVYVNATIKDLVDSYANTLQTKWGKSFEQTRLLTFEDLEDMGVTVSEGNAWCGNADLSVVPSFISDHDAYWTGSRDAIYASATGNNFCPVSIYDYSVANGETTAEYGLRPVIVVSKDKLGINELYNINKKIVIAGEEFYVIGRNGNNLKLITALNVNTTTYRQSQSANTIKFDEEDETDEYANASIKTLVDNYVNELQTRWGKPISKGGLLNYSDFSDLRFDKSTYSVYGEGTYFLTSNFPAYLCLHTPFWTDSGNAYSEVSGYGPPAYILYKSDENYICRYGCGSGILARTTTCN